MARPRFLVILTATFLFATIACGSKAATEPTTPNTVTVTAPAPPPEPSGPEPNVLAFEDLVLVLVNQQRVSGAPCGSTYFPPVASLSMSAALRVAARGHSDDMAVRNYFSHNSLDGRTFSQRIRDAGYTGSPLAENIAAGYSSPESVVAGWMASPGHCSNLMSASFRSIGVGYAFNPSSVYGHYWTQDFGGF